MVKKLTVVVVGVFAIAAVTSSAALAQASKCSGGKVKNAGKKAAAKLTCLSKTFSKGLAEDSTCLAKAEVKFSSSYAKAEAKVPNDCLTTADRVAIEAKVDGLHDDIDLLVQAPAISKCDGAKVKAAGKKAAAKLTCHSKAITKALTVDSTCLAKAEVKFSSAVAKAEAKVPTAPDVGCTATGDRATYESTVDAAVDDIVLELNQVGCQAGDCCTGNFLSFTNTVGAGNCGTVVTATGGVPVANGNLACAGLYFGGSGVEVPLPSTVPDLGQSITKLATCDSGTGAYTLSNTTNSETGSFRTCTSSGGANGIYARPGCLFGPPLPVPNSVTSATSTCVINRYTSNASGSGNCSGASNISFGLGSDLFLTGDLLPGEPGINPCPICTTGTCKGGANNGLACTPGSSDLGDAYPTSHDCPPLEAAFIGTLPIPFALTTGSSSLTANPAADGTGAQVEVFCGHCRSTIAPNPFQGSAGSPVPCNTNADCTTGVFRRCQQKNEGAFAAGDAHTISLTGSPSASLDDCLGHAATLVSTFCIPPSYNGLVDGAADLPGPGAVSLPGTAQIQ